MMKNEFIPYEEALALKELGFDEKCIGMYYHKDGFKMLGGDFYYKKPFKFSEVHRPQPHWASAPLYQQAFRWIREKYSDLNPTRNLLLILDKTAQTDNPMSYEEAELACLRKLIEIIKETQDIQSHFQ